MIDTNVWISGMLSRSGAPALLTRHVVEQGMAVFTTATFDELKERLWRPKFDRYVSMDIRKKLLSDLASSARWVKVPPSLSATSYSRDPADDMFIHAAQAASSTWLITGDDDLLCLHPLDGLLILTPRDALEAWGLPADERT